MCSRLLAPTLDLAQVRRVVVAGGTHGNEFTGVCVLEKLDLTAAELSTNYPSLAIEMLLVNPLAHSRTRRFLDDDLNRMFSLANLNDITLSGYEANRAKAISAELGPKCAWRGEPGDGLAADLCIDMHTTTANMGCVILVDSYCVLGLRAAAYAQENWAAACAAEGVDPDAFPFRVLVDDDSASQAASGYVCSVARHGCMIEVGPTPQVRM